MLRSRHYHLLAPMREKGHLTRARKYEMLRPSPTEETMAKGQMRSNKEKRKPKQDKGDKKKGEKK